ncbi:hypothetical protein H3V53_41810 [Paraburkholderia bengalensis]|uniref:Uncharacterized protein n=1 Tax=Paraburkholderia bengalensis TaxID=2747562 RepID=A0ABU8J664_9BURK
MDNAARPYRHRWLRRYVQGVCACLMLAIGTTWLGAIYDYPLNAGVVAGMNAPECASVRALPAGARLAAALPESDRCLALFMYRTSFPNAADDAASYQAWVLQQRVSEFWKLIGYVLVLWFVVLCILAIAASLIKALVRHIRHPSAPPSADAPSRQRGCW